MFLLVRMYEKVWYLLPDVVRPLLEALHQRRVLDAVYDLLSLHLHRRLLHPRTRSVKDSRAVTAPSRIRLTIISNALKHYAIYDILHAYL